MTADGTATLADLRDDIDALDHEIANLVADRMALADEVAEVKVDAGTDLVDEDREAVVESRYADVFEEQGLDGDQGESLARFLIETSLERERQVE